MAKKTIFLAIAPLQVQWEEESRGYTEQFSHVSIFLCFILQILALPFGIQPLLLRFSLVHGLAELLAADAA